MRILMVAAENDALPGGKVGGIADVVRDIPPALAKTGQQVDVVVPGYGAFSQLPGAHYVSALEINFAGKTQHIDIFKVDVKNGCEGVTQWVFEHPLFACGGIGSVYCNDPDHRPFASDASKFALFNVAVAQAILDGVFAWVDILHLHDWHAALIAVLREYSPKYQALKGLHTVYTIHNLALQGVRPFRDDESSLAAWFPELRYDAKRISDPNIQHCFNPVRAGINLSDRVHAVSPNYAQEILKASNPFDGFVGGEGLQYDLQHAANEGRLHGILNGCEYADDNSDIVPATPIAQLLELFENETLKWIANKQHVDSAHLIALTRLKQMSLNKNFKPKFIVTSVGRITDQKVRILQEIMPDGKSALTHLLNELGDSGLLVLLGSGDPTLEAFLTKEAAAHLNFIFLKGYSVALPDQIYSSGDLFLMPSSFEPCGISQMLSMRAGQACIAHSVGGLTDTIEHNVTGFTFSGETPAQQATNMLSCFKETMTLFQQNKKQWKTIADNAGKARFLWSDSAHAYLDKLYNR